MTSKGVKHSKRLGPGQAHALPPRPTLDGGSLHAGPMDILSDSLVFVHLREIDWSGL
jgi:hypothetical protein